jgi:hypothetical protein
VKITDVTFGQAVRFLTVSGHEGGRIYGSNLIHALESRYGFWESPKTVADYDMTKGVTFLHGVFQRRFVIDKLQIYNNGVLAEAKLPTDGIDEFIEDLIQWGRTEVEITVNNSDDKRSYASHVEVYTEMAFRDAFLRLSKIGQTITNMIRSYGANTNAFDISGFLLDADNGSLPAPKPLRFSFERRAGKPHGSGYYFSMASLKTTDHLNVLNELEAIIAATSAS